jgi:LSD1 subclass zinc finger protein
MRRMRRMRSSPMTDLCPSCREPLHYPSGDGCAAMTLHKAVQEQCTNMVYSAAFWAAVRGRMGQ